MNLATFFAGVTCASFLFAGVFFLKFWLASRDPFFRYFCTACWLLAIERVVAIQYDPSIYGSNAQPSVMFYLLRLAAFILIFVAVIQKNKNGGRPKPDSHP